MENIRNNAELTEVLNNLEVDFEVVAAEYIHGTPRKTKSFEEWIDVVQKCSVSKFNNWKEID